MISGNDSLVYKVRYLRYSRLLCHLEIRICGILRSRRYDEAKPSCRCRHRTYRCLMANSDGTLKLSYRQLPCNHTYVRSGSSDTGFDAVDDIIGGTGQQLHQITAGLLHRLIS